MHSTTHRFMLQPSYTQSLITCTNKPTLMVLILQSVRSPTISKLLLTVTVTS